MTYKEIKYQKKKRKIPEVTGYYCKKCGYSHYLNSKIFLKHKPVKIPPKSVVHETTPV